MRRKLLERSGRATWLKYGMMSMTDEPDLIQLAFESPVPSIPISTSAADTSRICSARLRPSNCTAEQERTPGSLRTSAAT